jgi:hypothetical protein
MMASRIDSTPASSAVIRSRPNAIQPCGRAPKVKASCGLLRRSDGWGGNLQLPEHASRVEVALMPRQRLVEQVWGVAGVRPSREGTVVLS